MATGHRALFDRKANQNLVPKPKNETKKRTSEKSMFEDRISLVLKTSRFM
jgi:hypothetical protein